MGFWNDLFFGEPAHSRIMRALDVEPSLSGAQLSLRTKLNAGRLYPCLFRMERDGLVVSEFESAQYPRRRFYRLAYPRTVDSAAPND